MTNMVERIVGEISTDCECVDEHELDLTCYEDYLMHVEEYVLPMWDRACDIAGDPYRLLVVVGKNVTWEQLSGYDVIERRHLVDYFRIRGDYRIVFTVEGTSLHVMRYSHDEPTGASFDVTLGSWDLGECDTCGGYYDVSDRETRCGECGDCGTCCQDMNGDK